MHYFINDCFFSHENFCFKTFPGGETLIVSGIENRTQDLRNTCSELKQPRFLVASVPSYSIKNVSTTIGKQFIFR